MQEKRYDGTVERLRAPERVARLEVERVVSLCLENTNLKSVLDIGTGSGVFAEAFSLRGLNVSGVDVNPEMIKAALQFVPQGDFQEALAEALPYPDRAFDLVFMSLLLHESNEPLKVLQEARRVVRQEVCILEWPFRIQEFGPPMEHRLNPSEMEGFIFKIGFSQFKIIPLTNLVLYRLKI